MIRLVRIQTGIENPRLGGLRPSVLADAPLWKGLPALRRQPPAARI